MKSSSYKTATDCVFTKHNQPTTSQKQSTTFGEHFKRFRKEFGFTMWELAKRIGVDVDQIEHIERDIYLPRPEIVFRPKKSFWARNIGTYRPLHSKRLTLFFPL